MDNKPLVLDLFCGAGGLSLGFKNAGFNIVGAIDSHKDPLNTYKNNCIRNGETPKIINRDITTLKGKNIINMISRFLEKKINIDAVIGGPPCQGFSFRGKRNVKDPRNNLIFEYFRIIEEIRPKVFVFENVRGLLTEKYSKHLLFIIDKIRKLGYHFTLDLLDASDYGVPQKRQRFIIIGNNIEEKIYFPKKSINLIKKEIYENYGIDKPKFNLIPIIKNKITLKEALDDIAYSVVDKNPCLYNKKPKGTYQHLMRLGKKKLYNHLTTKHKDRTIKILSMFKQGQSMKDIPKKYQTKRLSIIRMLEDKPSRTITSCNEDFIHYQHNRIITIREMARLQSFPDNYVLYGTPTTGGDRRKVSCCQVQQVANSVPPLLAQAIAESVLKILNRKSNNQLTNFIKDLNRR